jgi:hypothetical protein
MMVRSATTVPKPALVNSAEAGSPNMRYRINRIRSWRRNIAEQANQLRKLHLRERNVMRITKQYGDAFQTIWQTEVGAKQLSFGNCIPWVESVPRKPFNTSLRSRTPLRPSVLLGPVASDLIGTSALFERPICSAYVTPPSIRRVGALAIISVPIAGISRQHWKSSTWRLMLTLGSETLAVILSRLKICGDEHQTLTKTKDGVELVSEQSNQVSSRQCLTKTLAFQRFREAPFC